MGVKRLGENAAALIAAGRDPEQPAAAIERGTWPGQRTVTATLGTIAATVEREAVKAPALIVIGEVAARREELAWLERRPLHGRTVVVTRARAQASGLATTLRGLGADRGRAARDPDRVADREPTRCAPPRRRSPTTTSSA